MLGSAHNYEIVIHERQLDTFGHVNNAVYLDLFEEARWDLITGNGYGLTEVQRSKIGPTIVEINLRFVKEIRNRERITIKSWLESYVRKIGKFRQQMINPSGELCCDATFVMGLFDLQARKLIEPTPQWLAALGISATDLSE